MSALANLSGTLEYKEVQEAWQKSSPGMREAMVVFGAMLFVTILVLVWAIFFRRSRRRRDSRRHHKSLSREQDRQQPAQNPGGPSSSGPPALAPDSGKKRRRRRRPRAPLNPTLAQTGGLPPIRGQDPSETAP